MQIVIDISDYDKEWVTNGVYIPDEINRRIAKAIINGVPLPKGHGNLIDADAVMREMSVVSSRSVKSQMYIIKLAPIIIEAESEE